MNGYGIHSGMLRTERPARSWLLMHSCLDGEVSLRNILQNLKIIC